MSKKLFHGKIYVKKSKIHGFGVFASKKIRKGELLEECYFLVSRRGGDKALEDYYFDAKGKYATFLGYGPIYNHSEDPNADYNMNMKRRVAVFKADRTIQKDEEITISYGDKWFKSRGWTAKTSKTSKTSGSKEKPKKKLRKKLKKKAKKKSKRRSR